jgi:hypothetical protein
LITSVEITPPDQRRKEDRIESGIRRDKEERAKGVVREKKKRMEGW